MSKSPAFQFYPNDWLSSPKIMLMTPAEEGAYIRLLAICWMNGHLPSDDESLAELSRLKEGWFNGSSVKIKKCFTERGSKLYNERLSKERGKQRKWRKKCREGGLNSGKVRKQQVLRAKKKPKGSSPLDGDSDEVNSNSLSLPSISNSIKEKHNKKRFLDCVTLTENEHKKLVEKFGENTTDDLIEELNNYIMSKGKKYKSHYHTILSWARRKGGGNQPEKPTAAETLKRLESKGLL